MPVKIMLAVPTLNRLDRLTEMLHSVAASTRLPDRVLLVNNGNQITDTHHYQWSRQFELDVFTPVRNLGVAGSVNFAMRNVPEGWHFLHANDDIEYSPDCIERLATAAEQFSDNTVRFYLPDYGVGSAFTTFLIPQHFMDVVGYFDPQFFPAYFEDNCLGLRMNRLGIERIVVKDAAYVHHTSSTRLKDRDVPVKMKRHHEQYQANEQRYITKWGGLPDHETFELPYDGTRGHTLANAHLWHKERI